MHTDGVDMAEAFTGNPSGQIRGHLICTPLKKSFLVAREGKWAYLGGQGSSGWNGGPGSHVASGTKTLAFTGRKNSDIAKGTVSNDAPRAQLYDLEEDVNQTKNLYNEYPEVVKEMQALLETYKPAEPETPKREPRKKKRQK